MTRPERIASALCGAMIASVLVSAACVAAPAPGKTLYQRLGGYDVIAAVTDGLIGRVVANPQLAPFFAGHSTDSSIKTRQQIVTKLCEMTGGPCFYSGRDMKTAHAGMGISRADWDDLMKLLGATLDEMKVAATEKDDLLALLSKSRDEVVEKK